MSGPTEARLFDAIDWRLINYTNGNVGHDDTIRAIAADAAALSGEVVAKTDLTPVKWCRNHGLPRAAGLEDVCVAAYMPLYDPDEDVCRIVSAGLYLEGET